MDISAKRFEEIDVLRGLAAILTVIGHSYLVYPIDCLSIPWCSTVSHYIFSFHMPLFFVLAGFVYKSCSLGELIKKKTIRLLVPYFFFGILTAFARAFGSFLINPQRQSDFLSGLKSLFLDGGGYWFLYALFEAFIIFAFIEKAFNKCNKSIFYCVLVFIGTFCIFVQDFVVLPDLLCLKSFVPRFPYFIMGYLASRVVKKEKYSCVLPTIRETILSFLFLAIYFVIDYVHWQIFELSAVFQFIRTSLIIFCLFQLSRYYVVSVSNRKKTIVHRLLRNCSNYSMQLYLFTAYCLAIVRYVECTLLNITSAFITSFSIVFVTITITLILCRFILPHFPVVAFLCGVKSKKSIV